AGRLVNQARRGQPLAGKDQAGQRRQGWPRYAHHARLGVTFILASCPSRSSRGPTLSFAKFKCVTSSLGDGARTGTAITAQISENAATLARRSPRHPNRPDGVVARGYARRTLRDPERCRKTADDQRVYDRPGQRSSRAESRAGGLPV